MIQQEKFFFFSRLFVEGKKGFDIHRKVCKIEFFGGGEGKKDIRKCKCEENF